MKMPLSPPDFAALLPAVGKRPDRLQAVMAAVSGPTYGGQYLHWDKLRHRRPPGDLTIEEWWLGMKMARVLLSKDLPSLDKEGHPFRYARVDTALELVSWIDRNASGRIEMPAQVTDPATRDRYVVSSLMEEAITSSQLEGAATTRRVAKEMIRTGRPPRDVSERMIMNNYITIQRIRDYIDQDLTPELVLDLHRLLTADTLEDPGAVGRLRQDDERVEVVTAYNQVLHTPPKAIELEERLKKMCDFANQETPDYFIHPVVRAILLHFWLAYDHPFADGNGRTARALFYWSMLSQGYWLCEYISISRIITKAPARYGRAFLHTETDGNDVTYFVLHQLDVICRSLKELHSYLAKKTLDLRRTELLLRRSAHLNHRQIALLSHALRHADARYSIRSHETSHNVTYQTARCDLLELAAKGLLLQGKMGRTYYFSPAEGLEERLRRLS